VIYSILESIPFVVLEMNNADEWTDRQTDKYELRIICSFYSLGVKNAYIRENESARDVYGILNVGNVDTLS
jgi:hypothetical protein